MRKIETIKKGLLAKAESSGTEPVATGEMMEQAGTLFDLLGRQDVLALIYRLGNERGANRFEIVLTTGIRGDIPGMTVEEEVVFRVAYDGEERRYYASITGRIFIEKDDYCDSKVPPTFKTEGKLEDWLLGQYRGIYGVGEVLEFNPSGDWQVSLVRALDPGTLCESHGSRLEAIFETLASKMGIEDGDEKV